MNIERIREVGAHSREADAIVAKIEAHPRCEHVDGWLEDLQAELGEALRLLLLCNKPDPQAELMRAAA